MSKKQVREEVSVYNPFVQTNTPSDYPHLSEVRNLLSERAWY